MPNTENKVKYGLKNVYWAMQESVSDGVATYAVPKHWPGAVNLNLPPQGETVKFYADNVAYYVSATNDGYQGDFESALIPDEFAQEALGEKLVADDNVQVEYANVEGKIFALLFEFEGDQKAVRHVLYNCTASRGTVSSSTVTNTKTPSTSTLTITAAPLADGKVKAKTTAATTDEVYKAWYTAVWQPPAQTEGG